MVKWHNERWSELPAESDQDGKNGESHDYAMWTIGQVDCVQRELRMTDEHKEQNQTNQRSNQQQQSKE